MAAAEDWRTPEKRRLNISKLEEALRSHPGNHHVNPIDLEKQVFEKAKSQDDYQRTIQTLVLSFVKQSMHASGQHQVGPHPGQAQLPPHPGMANRAVAMGGRPPAPGYPSYQPPGMPPMQQQHPMVPQPQQPPQYNLNMNPAHPGMGMGVPPHSQQRSLAAMSHPQQPGQVPFHMSTANTYHPGPTQMGGGYRGMLGGRYTPSPAQPGMPGQMQPNMANTMAVQRPPMHASMMPSGGVMPSTSQMSQPGMPEVRHALPPQYTSQPPGNFLDNSVQSIRPVPNPSFSMQGPTKASPAPPYSSNPASSSGVQLPPKGMGVPSPYSSTVSTSPGPTPNSSAGQATAPTTQAQPQTATSIANPPTPHLPSLPVPSPAPATPLLPASPATSVGSPAPAMTPEENEAYLRKLGELQQRYSPLLQRMLTKLSKDSKDSEDKKRSDQYMKLRSLYNLMQDTNRRVPIHTLRKCAQALEKMFEQKPRDSDQDLFAQLQPTPASVSSVPPIKDPPPLPPHPTPEPPKQQASLKEFKIIPSPPPTASNLLATMQGPPFSADRLPPAKRLCNREEPSISPALMRELAQLEHFKIQRLPQPSRFDKAVVLECSLADNGLPRVPSLTVRIPPSYPTTSPECDLSHYAGTSFLKDVSSMLSERLSRSSASYTLSSLLASWESCVLRVTSKELSDEDDY